MTKAYDKNSGELIEISIEDEMKKSYLDYAMSVIVSRAIPDVRDGLKPVHRRILFSMHETSCDYNKPHKKSARIVGDVMGKYHPHGDAAIYESLVRMAQDFSLRVPLIDGQGNFGSADGDKAAAMRYTESRLAKISHTMLEDLERDTVDYFPNYDGSETEPRVLPAMFPNLLVNGTTGIAVGMATNIPTHNLGEVIDVATLLIDNPEASDEELMQLFHGPDFPTGGIIMGKGGIRSAILTGRGSVIVRSRTHIEEKDNRKAIVVTEMPYQVYRHKVLEKIAELVKDKKIEGISDLRDESNKKGVRLVVELKKDSYPDVVLNQLFSMTQLQDSFGINTVVLHNNRPELMNLRSIITAFLEFRETVITRRTIYLVNKARDRAHLLIGLAVAVANIDEVIALIRGAKDPNEAREALLARAWKAHNMGVLIELVDDKGNVLKDDAIYLTDAQARAILDMRLHRLTGLEHEKISNELNSLAEEIKDYMDILGSRERLLSVMKAELLKIRDEYATPRRTEVQESELDQDDEDFIPKEDMVVTVTMGGYIKRVPLSTYRAQRRGGKGRSGVNMHDDDFVTELFVANTHMPLLFFSNVGKVYKLKVYKLPIGTPQSKGRALVNIFPLAENEKITNIMSLPEDEALWDNLNIMFATSKGNVRRNDFSDFHSIQSNGKIAIRMDEGDSLVSVRLCTENDHILLSSREGKCIRFPVDAIRVFKSRTSDGVRGMRLSNGDEVMSMSVLHGAEAEIATRDEYLRLAVETRQLLGTLDKESTEISEVLAGIQDINLAKDKILDMAQNEEFILTICEKGYGKRSSAYEYRITNRGGSGIVSIVTSERNGNVVASFPVNASDHIILVTDKGTLIRCPVKDIRISGRNTQGVVLFRTTDGEKIVSAVRLEDAENTENGEEEVLEENAISHESDV